MPKGIWRAAIFAALLHLTGLPAACPAAAQDVTLTSLDGALSVSGTLISHDGEFYRLDSAYGLLVLDAAGVVCDGPACPDLTSLRAVIRIAGLPEMGAVLLPALIRSFAKNRGLAVVEDAEGAWPMLIIDPTTDAPRAEFHFAPMTADKAATALTDARADLVLTADPAPGTDRRSRLIGLDPMVVILSPENRLPRLSTGDLSRVLTGEIDNWAQVGAPDMPLVLRGLGPDHPFARVLATRLGRDTALDEVHSDLQSLSDAVRADPWAVAVTGRSAVSTARQVALTDTCGFPLFAEDHSVKSEDYPLVLPIAFDLPKRRLPLMAREFLDFLDLPQAQAAVRSTGLVDKTPEVRAMTQDGWRLVNAIKGAETPESLAELRRLVTLMERAERLSYTFRFQDGSTDLDAHSAANLADLALRIETGLIDPATLTLVGFSDGSGAAEANLALSQDRATAVQSALSRALPDMAPEKLPHIEAFGEALPIACDETSAGRRLNRRVEIWILNSP
jgi:phosphate transport system substrate-binding protein